MSDQQAWRKSSYSGGRENCVEVADLPGATAVRDSKHPEAAVLAFPVSEWAAFVRAAFVRAARGGRVWRVSGSWG
ncbi:DUF397 domain-containing protein [Thermobifida halotolerans]|uniref:DUF397 domain-containing protein n=1 Tax=Thermobifida halotolerans TaxID=483545 RepID=A0AA97LXH4_9ACTN|nr:DUF397 domain-containing protein [Thermobifida halotolerans]UOE20017.1 DUF397 domain-containing protein [Thermobifida halotolerans]